MERKAAQADAKAQKVAADKEAEESKMWETGSKADKKADEARKKVRYRHCYICFFLQYRGSWWADCRVGVTKWIFVCL
jgi:hypothetical protein